MGRGFCVGCGAGGAGSRATRALRHCAGPARYVTYFEPPASGCLPCRFALSSSETHLAPQVSLLEKLLLALCASFSLTHCSWPYMLCFTQHICSVVPVRALTSALVADSYCSAKGVAEREQLLCQCSSSSFCCLQLRSWCWLQPKHSQKCA